MTVSDYHVHQYCPMCTMTVSDYHINQYCAMFTMTVSDYHTQSLLGTISIHYSSYVYPGEWCPGSLTQIDTYIGTIWFQHYVVTHKQHVYKRIKLI